MLWFMGSQSQTRLNWTELSLGTILAYLMSTSSTEEQFLRLLLFFKVSYSLCSLHFISVAKLYPTLCDLMDCSTPGFPVLHELPELAQTHVHWVGDAVQPSHPLSSHFPPAFNLSQHQGLFQGVSSSHQVAKVLEFQLQHQSFRWIVRTDFLYDGLVWSPSWEKTLKSLL